MAQTIVHERVAAADRGQNPAVICRMSSGYLVLCDKQAQRGWCILLSVPVVADLDELTAEQQATFLADMAAAGAAIKRVTGACRMNYSILGNADPALHAHLQPRFADEPDTLRRQPLWAIMDQLTPTSFDVERDAPLMSQIKRELRTAGRCT